MAVVRPQGDHVVNGMAVVCQISRANEEMSQVITSHYSGTSL